MPLFSIRRGAFFSMRWLWLLAMLVTNVSYAEHKLRISTVQSIAGMSEAIDFVTEAYRRIGHQIEVLPMPAKRALRQARDSEQIDGVLARTLFVSSYLPQHIVIPVPVAYLEMAAFVKREGLLIYDWADLKNLKVAAVRGHVISENRLAGYSDVLLLKDAEQVLSMLARGRVDAAILPRKAGLYFIQQYQYTQLTIPPMLVERVPLYHFLHARHIELVEPLSVAMAELRAKLERTPSKPVSSTLLAD